MDPINPIAGNPEALNQEQTTKSSTDNHWVTIVSMAIFVLLSLAAVAFLYYQNQQLKSMLASYQTPIPTPTPSAIPDATAGWNTFVDKKFNYSFKYPEAWSDKTEVNEKSLGNFTIESDEGERIHGVTFSGTPDTENDKRNNGSSKSFVINNKTYLFVTYVECDGPGCLMGSKHLDIFNQVLSTFKFVSPTASPSAKPVACTQEAKLCPDGSSVGRTGPNCEFAPCPTP